MTCWDRPLKTARATGGLPTTTIHAAGYVSCPDGHRSATITRAYDQDASAFYIEATCRDDGCKRSMRVYDAERGTE